MTTETESTTDENRHYGDYDAGPEWATPEWVWKPLAESLGGFDLDPASGAEDEPIAENTMTVEDDGLSLLWYGDVWVNPPYGRTFNPKWAKKINQEAQRDEVDTITALIPASTDTQYFQNNYANADYLTFIEGRISFDGDSDMTATFPSVIATWGEVPEEYIDELSELGFVRGTN